MARGWWVVPRLPTPPIDKSKTKRVAANEGGGGWYKTARLDSWATDGAPRKAPSVAQESLYGRLNQPKEVFAMSEHKMGDDGMEEEFERMEGR